MKWKIQTDDGKTRVYENDKNSATIQTTLIYTDKMGNDWWAFYDLFNIPYLRIAYSKTISDLFRVGISAEDLKTWIAKEKELLRAAKTDPEQYEKLYALILEKEVLINSTVDPLQQHLALCTIYVLGDNEVIDQYSQRDAAEKMKLWQLDVEAESFFLTWHIDRMASYTKVLNELSQIALKVPGGRQPE